MELDRARATDVLPRHHRSVHHQSTHDRTHGGDGIRRRFTAAGIHPGQCGIATTGPDLPTPRRQPARSLHEACTKPLSLEEGGGGELRRKKTLMLLPDRSVPNHVRLTNRLTPLEVALASSPGPGGASRLPIRRCDGALHEEGVLELQAGRVVIFCQSVVCSSSACPGSNFPSSSHPPPPEAVASGGGALRGVDARTHHMHMQLGGARNGWGATRICIRSVSHLNPE